MPVLVYAGFVALGYLLGSIPSAYLIGRLWGKIDLRKEGDGHISATAVYRCSGRIPLVIVIIMDLGKGIVAIYLARLFIDSELTLIIIAYATVIGHCWSIFIGFKGGLGGLIMVTVLASLALKEAAIGLAVSLIILLTTRKSSWATYALQGSASVALLAEQQSPVMIVFPLGLIALHWLKRFQTRKVNPGTGYKHEVFEDLKRKK